MNEFDFLGLTQVTEEVERNKPLLHGKYGEEAYALLEKYREWNSMPVQGRADKYFHFEALQEALQHVCKIDNRTDMLKSLGILNTVMLMDSSKATKLASEYLNNMDVENAEDNVLMAGLYALLLANSSKSDVVIRNARLIAALLNQAMKNGELTYRKYLEYLRDGLDRKIPPGGWVKMRDNLMIDSDAARRFTISIIDHIRGEWGGTY